MISRGSFNKVEIVAAWSLAAVFTICGSIGMGIAVAKMHWRLGLCAAGALGIGALWAVAASRGRPVQWPFQRQSKKPK